MATAEPSGRVALSGIINIETTVPVERFPITPDDTGIVTGIEYHPSGVACNVASAFAALHRPFRFHAITGTDTLGHLARSYAAALPGAEVNFVDIPNTPQTIVLSDRHGDQVMFTDHQGAIYVHVDPDLSGCVALVPSNMRANYGAVQKAVVADIPVLVDIQGVDSIDGEHNAPYCTVATALAMSDRFIDRDPEKWLRAMGDAWGTPILVLGLGSRGALLGRDAGRRIDHVPAVPGPVRSTVGAGDALWACFVDGYLAGRDPLESLRRAVVFAGHKIGTPGGSRGFLSASDLDAKMAAPH